MEELKAYETAYILGLADGEVVTENFITDKIKALKDKIKAKQEKNKAMMAKLEECWKRDKNSIISNINNLVNGIKNGDEWKELPWAPSLMHDEEEGVLYFSPFTREALNGKLGKKYGFKNEDCAKCYSYLLQKIEENLTERNRKDGQSEYTLKLLRILPNYFGIEMVINE